MSDFKGIVKGGWHPKGKDGSKESWRGDFKGINQVAGWMGKGKSAEEQAAREHVSRPLATLKDPSAFGPPPKNVNYHGGAALPNEITPHRGGLGAPLSREEIGTSGRAVHAEEVVQEEQSVKSPPPALPYRADHTGLRTDNLPPPPTHRSVQQPNTRPAPSPRPSAGSQPRLPPRLPSRQNTATPPISEPPPPSYDTIAPQSTASSYINQTAVTRLGKAGISVPGLGIGNNNEPNPWKDERTTSQSSSTNQLSELQSRFARMSSPSREDGVVAAPSPTTQAQSAAPASMPSWKQSQSAFQTTQNLRKNPQSVSLADAQSAAQTAGQAQQSASAFREKHADKIATAQTKAKAWDQKYKVTSKINKYLDEQSEPDSSQSQPASQTTTQYTNAQHYQAPIQHGSTFSASPQPVHYPVSTPSPTQLHNPIETSASIARKPPPPPAPRKPANLKAPPPVPTGTKPNFG